MLKVREKSPEIVEKGGNEHGHVFAPRPGGMVGIVEELVVCRDLGRRERRRSL